MSTTRFIFSSRGRHTLDTPSPKRDIALRTASWCQYLTPFSLGGTINLFRRITGIIPSKQNLGERQALPQRESSPHAEEIACLDDLTVNCSEVVDLLEEIRSDKRMAEELCGSVLPRPQRSSTLRASRGSTSAVWAVCLFVALLGVPLYVDRFLV